MQLTLHTDIGLRVLIYIAGHPPESKFTVSKLADLFNLSKNHMIKIVHELGKKGYFKTVRGKGGGIYLARAPENINIASVVKDLERTTEAVDCQRHNCPFLGHCRLKNLLDEATEAFFTHLSNCTLADVLVEQVFIDQINQESRRGSKRGDVNEMKKISHTD